MLNKILNRFLDSINSETDIDESRRRVVKGIAGLAALAAVGANLDLGFKAITKYEFDKMAASGVIENVTFYLDRTLVIRNLDGLVLKNCRYIALDGFVGDCMLRIEKTSNLIINGGYFDTRNPAGVGINFDYDQDRYMSLDMLTIKNTL